MTAKGPVGGEAHFEEPDVLDGGVFEQLPGDAFHNFWRGNAVLEDSKGREHRMQVMHLVQHFDMLIQLVRFVGWERQIVFLCNVNDRLRADRPLEMTMDLRLGDVVVTRVKVFHRYCRMLMFTFSGALPGHGMKLYL